MAEIPTESPNKFGIDPYDDITDFADMLVGRDPKRRSDNVPISRGQENQDVDESFWRIARDNPNKYGS